MTRDLGRVHDDNAPASDPKRLDLPPETFRVHIGGVDGRSARIGAGDPLTGTSVSVKVVSRARRALVIQLPATDSPRLLKIEEHASP